MTPGRLQDNWRTHVRTVAIRLFPHAWRRRKLWGRDCIDSQRPQVDVWNRVSMRVTRLHQGWTYRGDRAWRWHHNYWGDDRRRISSSKWDQENTRSRNWRKTKIRASRRLEGISIVSPSGVATTSRSRRIRDMSRRYWRICDWNKRITQRRHATWTRRRKTIQDEMEVRKRTNVIGDRVKLKTIGMIWTMVTTRTACRWQMTNVTSRTTV